MKQKRNLKLALKRKAIDSVDKQIISFLERRFHLLQEIKEIKRRGGIRIYDKKREEDLIQRAGSILKGFKEKEFIIKSYKEILNRSLEYLKTHEVSPTRIFTVGHSDRSIKDFIKILDSQRINLLVDVRTIPKSRHNPQFGQERLKKSLNKHKISYLHLTDLGGLRHSRPDSSNQAWQNLSFRGFADYMQTKDFERGLKKLIQLSKKKRIAIMCAEAVPWRCHRSLIADALIAKKIQVEDVMSPTSSRLHRLTSFAKITKGKVTYPAKN